MASTNNLKRMKTSIRAWTQGFHENYRHAYNGTLPNYLSKIHSLNKYRVGRITQLEKNFRTKFTKKTNSNRLPPYLYRGMHTDPSEIINNPGYTSWTVSLATAKRFGSPRGRYGNNRNRGSVLRINTKLLKNIPVINMSRTTGESEVVLPPIKMVLNREAVTRVNNNKSRTFFVPVTNVILNSRFSTVPNQTRAAKFLSLFKPVRRVNNASKSRFFG